MDIINKILGRIIKKDASSKNWRSFSSRNGTTTLEYPRVIMRGKITPAYKPKPKCRRCNEVLSPSEDTYCDECRERYGY